MKSGAVIRLSIKESDRKLGDRYWKIRDPFIKEFSYGREFRSINSKNSDLNNPK